MAGDKIIFRIDGFTLRGFFKHMRTWVPFKGERLRCKVTRDGPISAYRKGQDVGNVPREVSKIFRKWVKAGGLLEVVVASENYRVHRNKGEEVIVTYIFTGTNNPHLINTRNHVKNEIEKMMNEKESIKFYYGDITGCPIRDITNNQQNNASNNNVQAARTNDENKASGSKSSPNSSFNDRKRKMDESEDKNETTERKKKKMKSSSEPGTSQEMMEFEVELSDKDLGRISHLIGVNWQTLGVELELSLVEVQQIDMDKCSGTTYKICNMLKLWQNSYPFKATLGHFMNAIDKCTTLGIDKKGLNKLRNELLHKRCKENVEI